MTVLPAPVLVGPNRIDISGLMEMNKSAHKIPYTERKVVIERSFPSARRGTINWSRVFSDLHTLGFVLQDVLKVDSAPPGRDGPRPLVNEREGMQRLREMWSEDYSYLSFDEILQALQRARGLSVRGLAAKIGINYGTVFRLLQGTRSPTPDEIVMVAAAFHKEPAFFLDYRIVVITSALEQQLRALPELSVKLHSDLVKGVI